MLLIAAEPPGNECAFLRRFEDGLLKGFEITAIGFLLCRNSVLPRKPAPQISMGTT